jgi:hypothetical protein
MPFAQVAPARCPTRRPAVSGELAPIEHVTPAIVIDVGLRAWIVPTSAVTDVPFVPAAPALEPWCRGVPVRAILVRVPFTQVIRTLLPRPKPSARGETARRRHVVFPALRTVTLVRERALIFPVALATVIPSADARGASTAPRTSSETDAIPRRTVPEV